MLFWLAVSLLCCHELDAMTHHEWRLLPGLSLLDDGPAETWFVLLHVPLFLGVFWSSVHPTYGIWARRIWTGLFVVHGVAHFLLSGHELYTFAPPVETLTVHGAAVTGLMYLFLEYRAQGKV